MDTVFDGAHLHCTGPFLETNEFYANIVFDIMHICVCSRHFHSRDSGKLTDVYRLVIDVLRTTDCNE